MRADEYCSFLAFKIFFGEIVTTFNLLLIPYHNPQIWVNE